METSAKTAMNVNDIFLAIGKKSFFSCCIYVRKNEKCAGIGIQAKCMWGKYEHHIHYVPHIIIWCILTANIDFTNFINILSINFFMKMYKIVYHFIFSIKVNVSIMVRTMPNLSDAYCYIALTRRFKLGVIL